MLSIKKNILAVFISTFISIFISLFFLNFLCLTQAQAQTQTQTLTQTQAQAQASQFQTKIKEKTLQSFKSLFQNIIFDVRGSRGGNGDVAASYLTIMDLLVRFKFQNKITMLVDSKSIAIIESLAKNNSLFWSFVDLEQIETLNQNKIFDLYIALANPSGSFRFPYQIEEAEKAESNFNSTSNANENTVEEYLMKNYFESGEKKIKVSKEGVLVSQTVLGNTENKNKYHSEATLISHGRSFQMSPAGLNLDEAGIYFDYVSLLLKDKTKSELSDFILSELASIEDTYSKNSIREIMNFQKIKNAQIGLVYGVTLKETQLQFVNYLEGLSHAMNEKSEPLFLMSPSDFEEINIEMNAKLKDKVIILSKSSSSTNSPSISQLAEPGKIYLLKTQTLPHKIFIALLAYSMKSGLVPLGSGDGFMSAALILGGPFALTQVPWNETNIRNLSSRLKKLSLDSGALAIDESTQDHLLIESVFEHLDLKQAQKLTKIAPHFKKLSTNIFSLTESLIQGVVAGQEFSKFYRPFNSLRSTTELIEKNHDIISDPILKRSLISGGKVDSTGKLNPYKFNFFSNNNSNTAPFELICSKILL